MGSKNYGEWESPISSDILCEGICKSISEFQIHDEQTYPKGNKVLYQQKDSHNIQWSSRDLIHEYGGGSFCITNTGIPIFTTKEGIFQLTEPNAEPTSILKKDTQLDVRYADLFFNNGKIYAVQETHLGTSVDEIINELVTIDFSTGNWDQTTVCIEEYLEDGIVGLSRKIDTGYSNFGLQWSSNNTLYLISDQGNLKNNQHNWNVHHVDLIKNKISDEIELPGPDICPAFWQFGDDRPYSFNDDNIVISSNECLWLKSFKNGKYSIIQSVMEAGFTVFKFVSLTKQNKLFVVASGPKRAETLIKVDLANSDHKNPEYENFESKDLPPVIILVHAGPTTHTTHALDLKKQFFTSRGFAVLDINYRGSTGKGRLFRNSLYTKWGIVDAEDIVNGVKLLSKERLADSNKACIIGSSSSGITALSAMSIDDNTIAASCISYGSTHKYEYYYTRKLIGPDSNKQVYIERSPLENVHKIKKPVALMHGKDDPVVPVQQSIDYYKALKKHGIYTKIKLFESKLYYNLKHSFR